MPPAIAPLRVLGNSRGQKVAATQLAVKITFGFGSSSCCCCCERVAIEGPGTPSVLALRPLRSNSRKSKLDGPMCDSAYRFSNSKGKIAILERSSQCLLTSLAPISVRVPVPGPYRRVCPVDLNSLPCAHCHVWLCGFRRAVNFQPKVPKA